MLHLILLVFALVFFALAAAGVNYPPRVQFGWLGLVCTTAAMLLGGR